MCLIIQLCGTGLDPGRPVTAPPPGLSVRGPLLQAPGLLVTRIMHRRRRLTPAHSGLVRLPHPLVCVAKIGQVLTLPVPAAGLVLQRQRLPVRGGGLIVTRTR